MNEVKRIFFANTWFLLPFRANGHWVEDATGKSVAEASDRFLAKALADTLNKSVDVLGL